ncbi:hypothetical protein PAPYR_4932 [Paratrimastix pyriformis]|uniref:Uncharacterized protein n=1 Tax=Paratrimastix pyriformis TaxID=342808 RepID=A0ABQ8UIS9_9EUKA|nr:hypothetical protein PAPYR_4932 [Paratrimastix pyriformis]
MNWTGSGGALEFRLLRCLTTGLAHNNLSVSGITAETPVFAVSTSLSCFLFTLSPSGENHRLLAVLGNRESPPPSFSGGIFSSIEPHLLLHGAHLWDWASSKAIASVGPQYDDIKTAIFLPFDRRLVVSGAADGALLVWELPPASRQPVPSASSSPLAEPPLQQPQIAHALRVAELPRVEAAITDLAYCEALDQLLVACSCGSLILQPSVPEAEAAPEGAEAAAVEVDVGTDVAAGGDSAGWAARSPVQKVDVATCTALDWNQPEDGGDGVADGDGCREGYRDGEGDGKSGRGEDDEPVKACSPRSSTGWPPPPPPTATATTPASVVGVGEDDDGSGPPARLLAVLEGSSGERHHQGGGAAALTRCAFAPSGRLAATASSDGSCRIWKLASGADDRPVLLHALTHSETCTGVAFLSDSPFQPSKLTLCPSWPRPPPAPPVCSLLVTCSLDCTLRAWDTDQGAMLAQDFSLGPPGWAIPTPTPGEPAAPPSPRPSPAPSDPLAMGPSTSALSLAFLSPSPTTTTPHGPAAAAPAQLGTVALPAGSLTPVVALPPLLPPEAWGGSLPGTMHLFFSTAAPGGAIRTRAPLQPRPRSLSPLVRVPSVGHLAAPLRRSAPDGATLEASPSPSLAALLTPPVGPVLERPLEADPMLSLPAPARYSPQPRANPAHLPQAFLSPSPAAPSPPLMGLPPRTLPPLAHHRAPALVPISNRVSTCQMPRALAHNTPPYPHPMHPPRPPTAAALFSAALLGGTPIPPGLMTTAALPPPPAPALTTAPPFGGISPHHHQHHPWAAPPALMAAPALEAPAFDEPLPFLSQSGFKAPAAVRSRSMPRPPRGQSPPNPRGSEVSFGALGKTIVPRLGPTKTGRM